MSEQITLPTLTCKRCGHSWIPRNPRRPAVCSQCKRHDWDKGVAQPSPTKRYRLEIYTWPGAQGVDPQIRTSDHNTPESALAHVQSQTEPFWAAVLSSSDTGVSYWECTWEGETILSMYETARIYGTNNEHPALKAMREDWPYLVTEVRRRFKAEGGRSRGTIEIATELLKERHPETSGWGHTLGYDAAKEPGK